MTTTLHQRSALDLFPVSTELGEFVASPFVLPILPGRMVTDVLTGTGGELFDIGAMAKVLHEDIGMCDDHQALYVFPRLLDAATVGRLLSEQGRRTLAEAMCEDYLAVMDGRASRLCSMIPRAQFNDFPLAFCMGLIFSRAASPVPLRLPRQDWWRRCDARLRLMHELAVQCAMQGLPMQTGCMPHCPSSLSEGFVAGVCAMVRTSDPRDLGLPRVDLLDAATVEIRMGSSSRAPVFHLSRETVDDYTLDALLSALHEIGSRAVGEPRGRRLADTSAH